MNQQIVAKNDTSGRYRYFDATGLAEYLYDTVADTIDYDLNDELGFVAVFDHASAEAREIVDMPDRRLSLLVRLCMQNAGHLSAAKRGLFVDLTEQKITAIESAVQATLRTQGREGDVFTLSESVDHASELPPRSIRPWKS